LTEGEYDNLLIFNQAANVLITDEGDAVICDFGLSLLKSEARKEAGTSGTMRWQSPERMQGAPLAFSCDVYSFGITICEVSLPLC
jgi:serine/threonine protein kinase